ncbi:MAG: response regulator transcription factor [Dehalococcoidaceae bacterium]|nr:response regulator transcription factor [Dehalococcoidaceae bacterium]
MIMKKALVVDDDSNLVEAIRYNLQKEGFLVVTADNGISAIELARLEKPNIIILDIMLPGIDGFEVCRFIRKEFLIPIIILSAKTEEMDKVLGLELGCDDYMTKPFSMRELIARIRTIQRRMLSNEVESRPDKNKGKPLGSKLQFSGIGVDVSGHKVLRNGQPIKLSPKEFDLLLFLMQSPGQVFNREYLVERVWGYDYEGTARTVDVHIRSLRKKIEINPGSPKHLMTIHGYGYKFESD